MHHNDKSVALIGGGPSSLFVLKHLVSNNLKLDNIYIFEKTEKLGAGMPYSLLGANKEHVANVSANELPELAESFLSYIKRSDTTEFSEFVKDNTINEYQVIPRLLLGNYLEEQFKLYIKEAIKMGINVHIQKKTTVSDIEKDEFTGSYHIFTNEGICYSVSTVILCTGHSWPKRHEEIIPNWYDSPYPPSKFCKKTNFPVAIRGTSLTAIDAVKSIARMNGAFVEQDGNIRYVLNESSPDFSIDLFSLRGFLPSLRFHSEDNAYSSEWIMSTEEIQEYKKNNHGFVDLDYVYDRNFKQPLSKKNKIVYNQIKSLSIEEFVEKMLAIRKDLNSFELFKAEYTEAEKSIKRHETIAWKETLSSFSYAMNYPAKHFSAEDMLRLKKTLLPLISVIIAALPQSSYKEVIALYEAGLIRVLSVDDESRIEPHEDEGGIYYYKDEYDKNIKKHYRMYVDAIGQQPVEYNDIPFEGLKKKNMISSGYLKFKSKSAAEELLKEGRNDILEYDKDQYYLRVKGLNINDNFQALDYYGQAIKDLYIMAVPYIAGLNPDYSGLDFCDTAAKIIANSLS
ncbi:MULTISPECIES: FAD/NAD(P)-binding protein [unclassified Chryseobacterium]|uniref:FAD/NAD(P)-binding protein n=1 Tax=unclassified Chryseobacterium TaxID=2593645 RepID=UPI00226AEA4E|nr:MULTISPECIES: FAD/NAD(P)-binding protein [unclassified Chryseobacterium]